MLFKDFSLKSMQMQFFIFCLVYGGIFLSVSMLMGTCLQVMNILLGCSFVFLNGLFFSMDGISLILIWLTSFVGLLCCLYIFNVSGFGFFKHNLLLGFILGLLIVSFSVNNLLFFYIFFESILVPMFLLIGLGSRGRKVHANYYFFFYTFVSSLPLLLGVSFIYYKLQTLNFNGFYYSDLPVNDQFFIFWLFFLGFAAKMPLLPLHIWLPEAHVEAPTIGSVILAAILLKLGAYGMYSVIFPLCSIFCLQSMKFFCIPFILVSVMLPACVATSQTDLKKIVAYSSVVHMSFSLLGLFSLSLLGVKGFLFSLISHGLISAAMFFSVGFLYDRFHTRNLLYYGGLVQFMPVFSMLFFFIIFSNMSFPGTCNFIGEFFVLMAIVDSFGIFVFVFTSMGLFAMILFCLVLLYSMVYYQMSNLLVFNLVDLNFMEFLILFFLCVYILFFGLCPNQLFCFLH